MIFSIIKWALLSLFLIILIHHLYLFFKQSFTTPIVKDLIYKPSQRYSDIINNLPNNLPNNPSNLNSLTDNTLTNNNNNLNMKNELENFLNDLKQSN